jgi:hypothetical protein
MRRVAGFDLSEVSPVEVRRSLPGAPELGNAIKAYAARRGDAAKSFERFHFSCPQTGPFSG